MLSIKNISFAYGRSQVLRDVSFTVGEGEIIGILGKNGAGKTTLMKILSNCLTADEGFIDLDGANPAKTPVRYRRRIGYVSERGALYDEMTIKEYLKFRAKLKGERTLRIGRRINEVLKLCRIAEIADNAISTLSMGMRKRVLLADALLRRPSVLLCDDLLPGLDQEQRNGLKDVLSSLPAHSSALITGHELAELATICTRFLILRGGRIAADISAKGKSIEDTLKILECTL